MARTTPSDSGDPVSNAVVNPQASLLIRRVLEAALGVPDAAAAEWAAEAQALLANLMMNDHLNWWNPDFPVDVKVVQEYVKGALEFDPPNLTKAHAYHARALLHRAQRDHDKARLCLEKAIKLDDGFARAHAQIGNQYVRLGQEASSYPCFRRARALAPNHPALGYFDWGEGRAHFQEQNWDQAIRLLKRSVKRLPTTWYNRCFLAAAQDAAEHTKDAEKTITDFIHDAQFQTTFPRIKTLPRPTSNTTVGAAWQRVLGFVTPWLP